MRFRSSLPPARRNLRLFVSSPFTTKSDPKPAAVYN
jgi:hypothetical protein